LKIKKREACKTVAAKKLMRVKKKGEKSSLCRKSATLFITNKPVRSLFSHLTNQIDIKKIITIIRHHQKKTSTYFALARFGS